MFAVSSRARLVHISLTVMFLFGAAVPTTALAKPSVIQNDLANSSDEAENLVKTIGNTGDENQSKTMSSVTENNRPAFHVNEREG